MTNDWTASLVLRMIDENTPAERLELARKLLASIEPSGPSQKIFLHEALESVRGALDVEDALGRHGTPV